MNGYPMYAGTCQFVFYIETGYNLQSELIEPIVVEQCASQTTDAKQKCFV